MDFPWDFLYTKTAHYAVIIGNSNMDSYEDKLSILSELIAFAKVDHDLKVSEYDFLLNVAQLMGLKKAVLDNLIDHEGTVKPLKTPLERIVQFHRLLLLMNVDEEQHDKEITSLYNIGLWMGLPHAAITQVLQLMPQYPNKVIPPKLLLQIFRAHYN